MTKDEHTSTTIGPFSIHLLPDGCVEMRTFCQTDRNALNATEALELLEWLYQQKDTLFQKVQQGKQAEV